jgi:putative acetyltransferase
MRRLGLEDMDRVAVIHRAAFDERLPWLRGLHTPEEDRAFYRGLVFTQCAVWGAGADDIVGFIAFREGWVEQFYVLPGYQGQGVGQRLLDVAKAAWPSLLLWTFQRNAGARRFYERRGFVVVEETDGGGNEEREPDVLYSWRREASRAD